MNLEQQYTKDTGLQAYEMRVNNPGSVSESNIIKYTAEYTEWLKERLTWKKFRDKKPDVGSDILVNGYSIRTDRNVSEKQIQIFVDLLKEMEWIYAPN